jgi:hypothetical protein
MADSDTDFMGDPSNPFPVAPDPLFATSKPKAKKDTKKAVKSADPDTSALAKGFDPNSDPAPDDTLDQGQVGNEDYKFTAQSNPSGIIDDYTSTQPKATNYTGQEGEIAQGDLLQQSADPKTMDAKQYDALTKEASKGNKLAQSILVSGHYQAHDYPSLQKDLNTIDDPFVNALSGLPALAENEQAQANQVTQPYDFSNAEAQVNNLLGQMGSSQKMTTSPETNSYLSSLQGIVSQGANNLNTSTLGIPSIMTALSGLGPAAKESEGVSSNAALLAALLSHQQYEDIYSTGLTNSSSNPAWLQNLIASVVGSTSSGGLPTPTLAAEGIGSTPSTAASPTGSNA